MVMSPIPHFARARSIASMMRMAWFCFSTSLAPFLTTQSSAMKRNINGQNRGTMGIFFLFPSLIYIFQLERACELLSGTSTSAGKSLFLSSVRYLGISLFCEAKQAKTSPERRLSTTIEPSAAALRRMAGWFISALAGPRQWWRNANIGGRPSRRQWIVF